MSVYQPEQLLALALRAGELMLKNGAETYRVEDMMVHLCKVGRVKDVSSFVIPTGIFISLTTCEGNVLTRISRVTDRTINLNKVSEVSDLTRNFIENPDHLIETFNGLQEIDEKTGGYSRLVRIAAAGVASASFAILFGGPLVNFAPALITGSFVQAGSQLFAAWGLPGFFQNAMGGALAALTALLSTHWGFGVDPSNIIVGTIMPLVPGVAITNALRDAMSGDLISSTSRTMEALLIALAIASGVALVLSLWYF